MSSVRETCFKLYRYTEEVRTYVKIGTGVKGQ